MGFGFAELERLSTSGTRTFNAQVAKWKVPGGKRQPRGDIMVINTATSIQGSRGIIHGRSPVVHWRSLLVGTSVALTVILTNDAISQVQLEGADSLRSPSICGMNLRRGL